MRTVRPHLHSKESLQYCIPPTVFSLALPARNCLSTKHNVLVRQIYTGSIAEKLLRMTPFVNQQITSYRERASVASREYSNASAFLRADSALRAYSTSEESFSLQGSFKSCGVIRVTMYLGEMELRRMLCKPYSDARFLVDWATAELKAAHIKP